MKLIDNHESNLNNINKFNIDNKKETVLSFFKISVDLNWFIIKAISIFSASMHIYPTAKLSYFQQKLVSQTCKFLYIVSFKWSNFTMYIKIYYEPISIKPSYFEFSLSY